MRLNKREKGRKVSSNEIINITEKAGGSIGSILVTDTSKKTSRVNAYITMPLQNFVSRYFEGQADKTAVELTADPQTQVFMLEKLARSNLANVKPNNLLKYLIYSHPPIMERINIINLNLN